MSWSFRQVRATVIFAREQREDPRPNTAPASSHRDGRGQERNQLEKRNHPSRGARRNARDHLGRIRRPSLPDHVVQPDQGRRSLARRSLARRAQRAAEPERDQRSRPAGACGHGARGEQGPAGATGAPGPQGRAGASGYEVHTWRYSKDDANSDMGPGYVGVGGGAIATVACSPGKSRWVADTGSRRRGTAGSTRRPSRTGVA